MGSGYVIGTQKIVDNGAASERFNLVLVAEGFQAGEISDFSNQVQQFVNFLFTTPPFDSLSSAFNVYRVDVASTESGADDPTACGGTGATVDTYFDASFCNGNIRRLLLVDSAKVIDTVDVEVPEWHQILVVVNSTIWGGAGGSIGTTSISPGWENIAIHEMGHAAFGLADEYQYWAGCGIDTDRDHYTGGEPAAPNVTINTDRSTIKWGDLILATTSLPTTSNPTCAECDTQPSPVPAGTVGAFEGAYYHHCGVYRPQYNCMMRNLQPFCAVCRARIEETMTPFLPTFTLPWKDLVLWTWFIIVGGLLISPEGVFCIVCGQPIDAVGYIGNVMVGVFGVGSIVLGLLGLAQSLSKTFKV